MNKKDKFGDNMPTAEFPAVTNRRKQLLQLELENQQIINQFRHELTEITVDLAEVAEGLDNNLKTSVLKRLLPTAQAVRGIASTDSVLVEIARLNQITESIIESQTPTRELSQRAEAVRKKIENVLSSIRETKPRIQSL